MRPLILITNDDGYESNGLKSLVEVASRYGEVVVVAPKHNSSGLSHSITAVRPIRCKKIEERANCVIYSCDGTPVDCVKIGVEHYCGRRPDVVLSGINHGSNASINVVYSGTMAAVMEASMLGYAAIGFSLLNHSHDADLTASMQVADKVIAKVLREGLPVGVSLNVNIPDVESVEGIRVCRQSDARWIDSYLPRGEVDGEVLYSLSGYFECSDNGPGTDQYWLERGYATVVPTTNDFTAHEWVAKWGEK